MEEFFTLLKEDKLFKIENKVLVAFSGGPDSIFVFKLLKEFQKYKNFTIELYHLNHGLRDSAVNDEEFVKNFAKENKCVLHLEHFDTMAFAKQNKIGTEEAGRIKRYNDLNEIAREIGTQTVITGHHLDDDIETMVMNFERGAGLNGISGIKIRDGIFFRPLLKISKREILDYLDENKIKYCIDETNFVDDVNRNRIRLNIIPVIRETLSDFDKNAKTLLSNLKSTQSMIEDVFEYFLKSACIDKNIIKVPIDKMLECFPKHRADLYLHIIKRLNNSKKDVYAHHLLEIDSIIEASEEKELSFSGIKIIKSYNDLIFLNSDYSSRKTHYKLVDEFFEGAIEIDADKINGDLKYTKRLPGDIFETRGGRTKKLKEILIDEKIPKFKRDDLVVIRDDLGIIFVEDLWLSKRVKADVNTKNKVYLRRYYE